jgi:hypothetical protein
VQNAATDLDNMRAIATRPVEVSAERGIGDPRPPRCL